MNIVEKSKIKMLKKYKSNGFWKK